MNESFTDVSTSSNQLVSGKDKLELLEDKEIKEDKEAPTRKIIHNGTIRMKVTNKDSANIEIAKVAEKYNGFVLKSTNSYSTIRIPENRFNDAIEDVSAMGIVKDKNITGDDVTEQFLDLGIRLDNALKTRDRYLKLLEKATTVSEALRVERELERLNGVIDRLKGKKERMSHLIAYSTLTVRYDQKKILGPLGYVGLGVYKAFKALFIIKS